MRVDRLAACLAFFVSLCSPCDAQSPDELNPAPKTSTQRPAGGVTKSIKETWKDVEVELVRPGKKRPETVNAKRAVYEVSDRGRSRWFPVVAMVAPGSGAIWVGSEQDLYLETETGMIGFRVVVSKLVWCESLLSSDGRADAARKGLPEVMAEFEREATGSDLLNTLRPADREGRESMVTRLEPSIENPWMFTNGQLSAQAGTPKIVGAERSGESIKLELTDQTGQFSATVWIDIKTRKVTKAEEGPWDFFPKDFGKPR